MRDGRSPTAARAGRRPQASCRVTADDLAAWARDPGAPFELTEMLPGPEDYWLGTEDGHHTRELRLVAVDRAAPTP